MVPAAHKTPRKLVEEALNAMNRAKILGLVFNIDDCLLSGYSYSYGQSCNGDWLRRLRRAVKEAGGFLRRGRCSRQRTAR